MKLKFFEDPSALMRNLKDEVRTYPTQDFKNGHSITKIELAKYIDHNVLYVNVNQQWLKTELPKLPSLKDVEKETVKVEEA